MEMAQSLSQKERAGSVSMEMIAMQPEIKWYMRPFLLDFLLEVHQTFRLDPQTLFLALSLVDRYCSKRVVFKRHYQLVGCTALWLAAKYEDKKSRVPTLKELVIMCREAYDEGTFVQMERHILSTLDWCVSHASLEDCLQMSLGSALQSPISHKIEQIARFLCELSLYNRTLLQVPASLVSTTAHLMACSALGSYSAVVAFHNAVKMSKAQLQDDMDDDATFDEDFENQTPDVVTPFLSGFTEETPKIVAKTAVLLLISFQECSQALRKKCSEEASIMSNFVLQNSYLMEQLPTIEELSNIETELPEHIHINTLTLLQLHSPQKTQIQSQSIHPVGTHFAQPHFPHSSPLATPPSASTVSVFSEREYAPLVDTPLTSPVDRSGSKRRRHWLMDESPLVSRERSVML